MGGTLLLLLLLMVVAVAGTFYIVNLARRSAYLTTNTLVLTKWPDLGPILYRAFLSLLTKPKQLPSAPTKLQPVQIIVRSQLPNTNKLATYKELSYDTKLGPNEVPILYPAVETFILNIAAMCTPNFPVSVVGGVLAKYSATQLRPISAKEVLTYRLELDPQLQQTAKGDAEFCTRVVATVEATGEEVWRDLSTFLSLSPKRRMEQQDRVRDTGREVDVHESDWIGAGTAWLKEDVGRRFAALNSDYNPIHLYAWTASLFGFRSNVAHGHYMAAVCLSSLARKGVKLQYPQTVELEFKRPGFLPFNIGVQYKPAESAVGSGFDIEAVIEGTVKPLIVGTYRMGQ